MATAPIETPQAKADPAEVPDRPSGPAAAMLLATGFASMVLGLLTSLSEADAGTADALTFDKSVGALSGKTIITICVFFATFAPLAVLLRRKNPPLKPIAATALAMLLLGFMGILPWFFEIFAD